MAEEVAKQEGDFKMKKKKKPSMKKLNKKDNITKVDLTKKQGEDAVQEQSTTKEVLQSNAESTKTEQESKVELPEVVETHAEEQISPAESKEIEDVPVIQEITNEEETETKAVSTNTQEEVKTPEVQLPENVEKLVDFMKDTGGTVEDYVRLNADYSNVDGATLLKEYYKQTKPHLNTDEINFMMEDKFHYDEDMDEERDIRKKKLAMKEEIAEARGFLDSLKSKYYDEIKLRPGTTQEQQKATDFFNRYNEEQDRVANRHKNFVSTTNDYFSNEFKGFDFNLGEKKFRYGVNNPQQVAQDQSDISLFLKKFLNEDGSIKDYQGYHKAMYAARNADTIAKHFYDQGIADGTKNVVASSKNINTDTRNTTPEDVYINGWKVKAISGIDSSKLKIKRRKTTN